MRTVGMTVMGLLVLASRSLPAVAQDDSIARLQQAPLSAIYINTQAVTRLPADRATIYLIVDASAGEPTQANERASSTAAPAVVSPGVGPMPGATFGARSVLRVELRHQELMATVATAAFGRGVTLIGPIQFSAVTSDSARRTALASSLAQARQDAEELARSAGGRLGRLLDVNMNSAYSPDYNPQQLPLGGPHYQYDAAALTPLDHSGANQEPRSLAGRWAARFVLTRSARLPFPTLAREVSGEIRFSPAAPPPLAQDEATWRLVHPGVVAVDFLPLGFKLGNTEALGWHATPDTVRIILDPTVDHGSVEVVGSSTGTELAGRWELLSDLARAEGEFTLRRLD